MIFDFWSLQPFTAAHLLFQEVIGMTLEKVVRSLRAAMIFGFGREIAPVLGESFSEQ